jgi:hypothetical protein
MRARLLDIALLVLVGVVLAFVGAACSGPQQPQGDPLANVAAWQSANARLEAHFERTALPPTLDVPVSALKFVLQDKLERHEDVRDAFVALYDTNDLVLRSAATLRVGQLDLNLACELVAIEPPDDFGDAEAAVVRDMLLERATPIFGASRRSIRQASRMGDGPYAQAATDLAADFPAAEDVAQVRSYCDAHRKAWHRPSAMAFDVRMIASCEAGVPASCYVASLLIDNRERAADYAERACTNGIGDACAASGIGPAAPKTCAEGLAEACWLDARALTPEDLQDYTRYCFAGSGFDCFRRGLLLETSDGLMDACRDGAIPLAASLDEARRGCDDGDVKACFQLGVATYQPPRELEKVTDPKRSASVATESSRPGVAGQRDQSLAACIERDNGRACARVARSFATGRGLPKSEVCAARFLFGACNETTPELCWEFDSLLGE